MSSLKEIEKRVNTNLTIGDVLGKKIPLNVIVSFTGNQTGRGTTFGFFSAQTSSLHTHTSLPHQAFTTPSPHCITEHTPSNHQHRDHTSSQLPHRTKFTPPHYTTPPAQQTQNPAELHHGLPPKQLPNDPHDNKPSSSPSLAQQRPWPATPPPDNHQLNRQLHRRRHLHQPSAATLLNQELDPPG